MGILYQPHHWCSHRPCLPVLPSTRSPGFWETARRAIEKFGLCWVYSERRNVGDFRYWVYLRRWSLAVERWSRYRNGCGLGCPPCLYALQQGFCIFTTPETRSFPCHLLRSRTQVLFYVITTCANTCMFFTMFYIPIYLQFTRNDTSLMAAVRLLPYLVLTITVNLTTGWALPRVKYYMPMCLVSDILMTISSAMFVAYLSPSTPTPQIYGFSILMGVGTGITIQLGYSVSNLKVAPTDSLSAINLQNVAQIGATVLSIVLANQVFQSTAVRNLNRVLADQGFSQEDIHGIVAGSQSTLFGRLNSELRTGAIGAITSAMARAFIIPLVAGALGTIASLILKRERLFG
ncbi:MFS drug efflux transporter [Histoplasma ohiense]|nr:MFS drug efflux transporter [Histoplasma ohiense (nom. inval.)]